MCVGPFFFSKSVLPILPKNEALGKKISKSCYNSENLWFRGITIQMKPMRKTEPHLAELASKGYGKIRLFIEANRSSRNLPTTVFTEVWCEAGLWHLWSRSQVSMTSCTHKSSSCFSIKASMRNQSSNQMN